VIADVLLDKAVAVMAADHGIGQIHVLDLGFQLAPILLADFTTEDDGDFVRLADGSIGVKQTFAEIVQRRTATEDEVVAVLDLREEQPVLAARMFSLSGGEEGREMRQPLLTAGHQIPRSERVGEFLQAIGSWNCKRGKSRGDGKIIRFSRHRESDSLWECRLPQTLTAFRPLI
jgi:hypothetical protein